MNGSSRAGSVICRVPSARPEAEQADALKLARASVGDLMTRNVLCVRPDLSLDAVTELFVQSGLKAAPVVDEQNVLLGMVTESDVLIDVHAQCRVREPESYRELEVQGERLHETAAVRTVAEVMMPVVLTLREGAPMTQAAALMAFEGVFHLVVLSREGKVVGILSAADILYRLARSDGYVLPRPHRLVAT
jgi:CBS-domain-containing membrane protein